MVSTSSTAVSQVSENEKRRKQTLEKVKANHLSRQLQMRLQYARLKVEHGWQKQNLNEVENLYFHNSHIRGPKHLPANFTTTQPQNSMFPVPSVVPSQSSLSFKLGPTTLGRIPGQTTSNELNPTPIVQDNTVQPQNTQSSPAPYQTLTPSNLDLRSQPRSPNEMDVDHPERTITTPRITPVQHSVASNAASKDINLPQSQQDTVPVVLIGPPETRSSVELETTSTNQYTSVKSARPRTHKTSSSTKSLQSLTSKEMFNFGSSSTLTYDSFWSSHAVSAGSRPTRVLGISDIASSLKSSFPTTNATTYPAHVNSPSTVVQAATLPPPQQQ